MTNSFYTSICINFLRIPLYTHTHTHTHTHKSIYTYKIKTFRAPTFLHISIIKKKIINIFFFPSNTNLKSRYFLKKKNLSSHLSSPSFEVATVSLFPHPFNQESEYGTFLVGMTNIFRTDTLTGTNLNTKTQSLTKQKELRPLLLRETFIRGPILDAMAASYMRKQREICNLY